MLKDVYTIDDLRNWPEATAGVTPPIRLAVFGDPVSHSKSPVMHNAALADCGIDVQYTKLHIKEDELAAAVRLLANNGFIGANVTIPHKAAMFSLIAAIDNRVKNIGMVNTVLFSEGEACGFNTDGSGFENAIREKFGLNLKGLRILVLGAGGGAGRAISIHCASAGAKKLWLVNRTIANAIPTTNRVAALYPPESLSEHLSSIPNISGPNWSSPVERGMIEGALEETDLIVNCTSLGMKPDDPSPIPASLIFPRHFVYDTIYTAKDTPLMVEAGKAGAESVNGLSMLLHQGALSFEIWFNREAPLDVMRKALIRAS